MHRTTWLTPSERRWRRSPRPTPCGYSDPSSNMSERHPDTDIDRPTLIGAWVNGRFVLGEEGGDSGQWISAEATVEIEDAR